MSIQSGGRWLFREWRSEVEKSGGMIRGCCASTELAVAGNQGPDDCGRRSGVSPGISHRIIHSITGGRCQGFAEERWEGVTDVRAENGCRATSLLAC